MRKRLAGWKTKFLNLARRTVLAKATLSSIASHVMQYIKLPAKLISTIHRTQRDFVWGTTAENRKIHLLHWDNITNTRATGGFGL
ncbi:hypothetical protein R3W88_008008 [Solanum pinnatisectum]|uniref:Reverse transcriptase n=1 Tax=Solanum pinnatisectum TaxID=50273 RepID=A0AAV9M7A7_9SOLN|nr:hypothetical protein R3W88_008008 [Solanum pinnatisectum]